LFMEPKRIYRAAKGEVPDGDYTVPLGKAAVVREGTDITILSYGAMLHTSSEAAELIAKEDGTSCEVIDLRSLVPLDAETILESVKKTGRVVVVHEAPRNCGFGAELIAMITEKVFLHLQAPPIRVTGFDTPFPFTLENEYLPDAGRIRDAVRQTMTY